MDPTNLQIIQKLDEKLKTITEVQKLDKEGKPVPVTADYDLLATGSKEKSGPVAWDKEKGAVSPEQSKAIDQINNQVNHSGGDVVHHGPETNNPKSEGPKYPVSSFEPDGKVHTFNNKEDLKNYFNQKKGEGYNMDWPPAWG